MGLKDLFSNLKVAGELLTAMIPSIDSKLLVFAAGIILGFLETNGYANPHDHTQNLDALSQFMGSAITIVTIVSYYMHDAVVKKNKLKYGDTTPTTPQPTESLLTRVKTFVFKPEGGGSDVLQEKLQT